MTFLLLAIAMQIGQAGGIVIFPVRPNLWRVIDVGAAPISLAKLPDRIETGAVQVSPSVFGGTSHISFSAWQDAKFPPDPPCEHCVSGDPTQEDLDRWRQADYEIGDESNVRRIEIYDHRWRSCGPSAYSAAKIPVVVGMAPPLPAPLTKVPVISSRSETAPGPIDVPAIQGSCIQQHSWCDQTGPLCHIVCDEYAHTCKQKSRFLLQSVDQKWHCIRFGAQP